MVKKKELNADMEFGSIFHDPKWIQSIKVKGFTINKPKANYWFMRELFKLIGIYNTRRSK